jgi:hypothetical protein
MVQSDAELTVAQRLGQLLDRGLLPAGGPAEAAERLIERLERPARVALLGLPGAGKSAILNLLTGAVVVPETLRLPTIIVQHGLEPRMVCTLTDGRTETVPGSDLNDVLPLNPALVTLEMDLPALKVISLLEVSAGPMEAEQRRAAIWASKRADILIWCTTSYLPKEQQVWEGMPDVVKDNGFLFLTKVDLLGSREAAHGMLERVEVRAGEEFRQVLSISAKQARSAMAPDGAVDREMFRDSGAAAVITTIKSRVQAARRADTDMAELLLARHVEASGIVARRFAEPAEVPVSSPGGWTAPPEATPPEAPAAISAPVDVSPAPEPAAPEPVAPVSRMPPEPMAEELPDPVAEPEPDVFDAGPAAQPEPVGVVEPDPVADRIAAPAPEPPPAARPAFTRAPAPEAEPTEGRKRFSDRIKQMPVPVDAPAVPLRSTWKSKAETAAARTLDPDAAVPDPQPKAVPDDFRTPRMDPRARPATARAPEPQEDDATLSRMLASVASEPEPEPEMEPEPESAPEPEEFHPAVSDTAEPKAEAREPETEAEEAEDPDPEETADAEDASPRWAERLRPAEPSATAERSPRTSLFGTRKPVAPAGARPPERAARPTEPVMRVRAPAARPAEPPRPVAPSPEELATPRFVPMREREQPAASMAEPPRTERRERPRIARVIAAAPAVQATVAPPEAVPAAEKDLLDAAIRHIMARSTDLAGSVNPEDRVAVDTILDHSRETIEQVIALLGPARSSGLRRIVGDLGEIQDIIMLMQLEKGHAPADDALTLVLQIRRDLETLHAA